MPENSYPNSGSDQPPKPFASPDPEVKYATPAAEEIAIERESLSLGGKLAWLTIVLVATAMIATTAFFRSSEETRTEATESDLFPVQLQGRTIVGQKGFLGGSGSSSEKSDASTQGASSDSTKKPTGPPVPPQLNAGTYEQRLCYVILVSESNGPDAAAAKLAELDEAAKNADFQFSETQTQLRDIVGRLIENHQQGDFDGSALSDEERELLKEKLGWIGELALVPEGTRNTETRKELLADASWSLGIMLTFMVIVGLTLMTGLVIAAAMVVFFATKKLSTQFATHGTSVNIYVETFAIWLVLFFAGPQLTVLAIQSAGVEITGGLNMAISVGFFFGSLVVLAYPVLRGIKFSQVRRDIGWTAKGGGFMDLLVSPLNYIAGTPLMFLGLICVVLLTIVASLFASPKPFGTGVAAGHPIQEMIASGSWFSIGYVVIMACVAAPIVEETMFRGVLYRHLRELSGSWATWVSVAFSAVFNGLIFAAIHPQGFVAIPLLTALAINFSLAREWRDSLIAPVIMHSINNSMVTVFMLIMMS